MNMFTAMNIMKWHYQPDGAWQLTHAEYCGTASRNGLHTTRVVGLVTCKRCLKKMSEENV